MEENAEAFERKAHLRMLFMRQKLLEDKIKWAKRQRVLIKFEIVFTIFNIFFLYYSFFTKDIYGEIIAGTNSLLGMFSLFFSLILNEFNIMAVTKEYDKRNL